MHLSECLTISSPFHSSDERTELSSCLSKWLLRSTTEFYDQDVNLPWYFGALCLSYTIGGLGMFIVKPKWTRRSNYPYVSFALFLAFVQGPLSFSADYKNFTRDSIFHVIDRVAAIASLSMELWKIFSMFFYSRKSVFYWQLVSVIFAMSSFINGQNAQLDHNMDGFIFWHNMWHIYPLMCISIQFYDYFVLGEYEADSSSTLCENPRFLPTISLIQGQGRSHMKQTFVQELLRRRIQSENTFSHSITDKKSE